MKAMIFAAGLGTRLLPLTNELPKALVPINGKPALQWLILRLKKTGITQIIINVHHFADKVIDFINQNHSFGIDINFSDEREMLLDTGGGLKKAAWFFDDNQPFLVHNADILSDINIAEMLAFHNQNKALATLLIQKRITSRYLIFDEEKQLSGWKNIKTSEIILARQSATDTQDFAFNGIHIIDPEIFTLMKQEGKFPIIETYLQLAQSHRIIGFSPEIFSWMDIGKPENLPQASFLARKIYGQ
jgi:NDP-sugar pyrophosphorylase family protein